MRRESSVVAWTFYDYAIAVAIAGLGWGALAGVVWCVWEWTH